MRLTVTVVRKVCAILAHRAAHTAADTRQTIVPVKSAIGMHRRHSWQGHGRQRSQVCYVFESKYVASIPSPRKYEKSVIRPGEHLPD